MAKWEGIVMDNMFGPFGEMFDFNNDGKLDLLEFGVMMNVLDEEENFFGEKEEEEVQR